MGSRNAAVTESEFPTSILLHILTNLFYLKKRKQLGFIWAANCYNHYDSHICLKSQSEVKSLVD